MEEVLTCLQTAAGTDSALHTQLWIDPTEELLEYSHSGMAADVTFSVKELKVGLPSPRKKSSEILKTVLFTQFFCRKGLIFVHVGPFRD